MLEADSLPTQRKDSCSQSQSQLFLTIEDELRDARRVQSHGLEEDLRQALQMVINRVSELVSVRCASRFPLFNIQLSVRLVHKTQGSLQRPSRTRNIPQSRQIQPPACTIQQ